jgi:hypothetical protein
MLDVYTRGLLAKKKITKKNKQGGNFLGVLHSMGYTRGLLANIGFSERLRLQVTYAGVRWRMLTYADVC